MLQSTVSLMLDDETHATRKVDVAVVGLGEWGPKLLRVLGDNLDVEVRWICDLDSSRLAKCRHRHPSVRVTTRLDRILDDPRRRRHRVRDTRGDALQARHARSGCGESTCS